MRVNPARRSQSKLETKNQKTEIRNQKKDFGFLVSAIWLGHVILSMYSPRRLSVMSETECIANGPALSLGERVDRDRRLHQPARAG
jgi:hypothetical protein